MGIIADPHWMAVALEQARQAAQMGEVPVGAVLVRDGQCIAAAHNAPIQLHDPTAHAEIQVLRAAGRVLGNYRFAGCDVYVSLEPCGMCVGALIHARVRRVIFGAADPKTGALGGAWDIWTAHPSANHHFDVVGGCLADQSRDLLQAFFQERRAGKR